MNMIKTALVITLASTMVACGGGGGSSTPAQPAPPAIDDVKPAPVTSCEAWVNNGDGTESRFCKETVDGVVTRKWTETRDIEDTTPPAGGGNGGDQGGDDQDDGDNGNTDGDSDGDNNEEPSEYNISLYGFNLKVTCVGVYNEHCAQNVEPVRYGYGETIISMYDESEAHRDAVVNKFMNETMAFDQNVNTLKVGQYAQFYAVEGFNGSLTGKFGDMVETMIEVGDDLAIITSSTDRSPDYNDNTAGQYGQVGEFMFHRDVIPTADLLDASPLLYVTSMENSDVSQCAAPRATGINLCGELDTLIAYSGTALDQTIYVSTTNYSQDNAGIHEGHILVVDANEVFRGYTSHATPFVAGLAGQVADHFGLTDAAEVKAKMFEFVVDGVLDHAAILAL